MGEKEANKKYGKVKLQTAKQSQCVMQKIRANTNSSVITKSCLIVCLGVSLVNQLPERQRDFCVEVR